MTERSYAPGSGNVAIILGGSEFVLRPSLDAALTLSRQAGGIRAAITKVVDLDLDTIVSVIRLGIGRDEAKRIKDLDRLIWESGLLDNQGEIVLRCVDYLSNIARGGRPADESAGSGGGSATEDPT